MIGIAGSFCSGDIHERSDLDLCIVINDDDGWKISSCFILNEVGFDIYCTPWHRLEAMAEYTNPFVTKLLDLDIVYHADEMSVARYMALRKIVQDKLDAPFSFEDANNVTRHFADAMRAIVLDIDDQGTGNKIKTAPYPANTIYLKIERQGPVFDFSYSPDGVSWTALQRGYVAEMPANVEIFLTVGSWGDGGASAKFYEFKVLRQ